MIGAPRVSTCMALPAKTGAMARVHIRARLVTPPANVRSSGFTTAIRYDWRVGTSISESPSRRRNSTAAISKLPVNGMVKVRRLEGVCVNTMVFTRPMRAASQAAPKCENAFMMRAPTKSMPIAASDAANCAWKKYAKSALPWKPPAKLSSAKRKDIFVRMERLCGLTSARSAAVVPHVLDHVVPREGARAAGIAAGGGQDRLLDRKRRGAILAERVQHAEERGDGEHDDLGGKGKNDAARCGEHPEPDQPALAADSVAPDLDPRGDHRRAGDSGAEDRAPGRRVEPELREIDAGENADQAVGDRAQETRGENDPAIADHASARRASPSRAPGTGQAREA